MPLPARRSYHHGELKAALIAAADDIIRDSGIEGFSLREAARRAGVSPGAPAHHFNGVVGLLTEVTVMCYRELGAQLHGIALTGYPAADLRALTARYVRYAFEHPGRFQLMYRKDLVDREDPELRQASRQAMLGFSKTAAAYHGVVLSETKSDDLYPGVLAALATAQGIAHMTIEDKWSFIAKRDNSRAEFMEKLLPAVLQAQWPDRPANNA